MKRLALALALTLSAHTLPAEVLYSGDGGKTWTSAGLAGSSIGKIYPDPADPKIAVALLIDRRTLHRTADGGKTWKDISPGAAVLCVALDPSDPKSIWVGGESGTFSRSKDAGATWTKGEIGAPAASKMTMQRTGADGKPVGPAQGVTKSVLAMAVLGKRIYAGGGAGNGFMAASDDDGKTWTAVEYQSGSPTITAMTIAKSAFLFAGTLGIAASTDSGKTFKGVAGVEGRMGGGGHFSRSGGGDRVAYSCRGQFVVSADGGKTWGAIPVPERTFPSSAAWAGKKMIVVAESGEVSGGLTGNFTPDPDYKVTLFETEDSKTWKASPPTPAVPTTIAGTCDGKGIWLGTR